MYPDPMNNPGAIPMDANGRIFLATFGGLGPKGQNIGALPTQMGIGGSGPRAAAPQAPGAGMNPRLLADLIQGLQ